MSSCNKNVASFTKFKLPLMRKMYPTLIANSLVGVQPMSQPASLIYYIRHRYSGSFVLKSGFYALVGTWYIDGKELVIVQPPTGDPDEAVCYVEVGKNETEPGQDQEKQKWTLKIEFEDGTIHDGHQEFMIKDHSVMVYDENGSRRTNFLYKKMAAICLT